MVVRQLQTRRLHEGHAELASFLSIGLSIGLWIRAKTVDQSQRGHAEWRALFVGLWAPTLWLARGALRRQK